MQQALKNGSAFKSSSLEIFQAPHEIYIFLIISAVVFFFFFFFFLAHCKILCLDCSQKRNYERFACETQDFLTESSFFYDLSRDKGAIRLKPSSNRLSSSSF